MNTKNMGEIAVKILASDALFPKGVQELTKKAMLHAKLTKKDAEEFSNALHDISNAKYAQRRLRDQLASKHRSVSSLDDVIVEEMLKQI